MSFSYYFMWYHFQLYPLLCYMIAIGSYTCTFQCFIASCMLPTITYDQSLLVTCDYEMKRKEKIAT